MTVLNADPKLEAYLSAMKEQTEIRDSQGKLLGIFTPADQESVVDYSEVRKLIDREEIMRRKERSRNDPGRPLKDLVDHLRSMEQTG